MKIATWNVNGVRARMDYILHWLKHRSPDVVGLQELKASDADFPADRFAALGYSVAWHGQKSWNGVAVLSRESSEVVARGLPGQEQNGSRLLTVRTVGLHFTTVYCPNGKHLDHQDFGMKLDWFEELAVYCEEIADSGEPAVVCGDFNVVQHPLDSHLGVNGDGQIFHTEEERARVQSLLDLGFIDLYRSLHPQEKAFTWWDYRAGAFQRGMGLRIDLVLGSRDVLGRLRSASIDRQYRKKVEGLTASDHCPVIVELDCGGT